MIKEKLKLSDIRPGDILILIAAVIFIVYLFKQHWFTDKSDAVEFVAIQVANQPAQLFPAQKTQKITVIGANGESGIEIREGKARFLHSHCFNQICITHGWVSKAGETIACLPNKVSVSLIGRNSEYDALNF